MWGRSKKLCSALSKTLREFNMTQCNPYATITRLNTILTRFRIQIVVFPTVTSWHGASPGRVAQALLDTLHDFNKPHCDCTRLNTILTRLRRQIKVFLTITSRRWAAPGCVTQTLSDPRATLVVVARVTLIRHDILEDERVPVDLGIGDISRVSAIRTYLNDMKYIYI